MVTRQTLRLGWLPIFLLLVGCSTSDSQIAANFIARMDALAPEQRVPNWESTKALMLREAPGVGDIAPDFTLTTRDGSESMRLSQFKDDKPVVLIFGSWT